MELKDRQQQVHIDIFAESFLLETDRRNEADQAKRCQAYAGAASGRKSEK